MLAGLPGNVPESAEALRGLALSHMRLGQEDEALRLLARVLELDPEHAEAELWTARILYDLERTEDALTRAERARGLAPHEPGAWFLLTQIYFDLGRDDDAEEAQTRWRELDRLAQETRLVEGFLRVRPADWKTLQRLVELERAAGDLRGVRAALARLVPARPEGVRELDVLIYSLDVLVGDERSRRCRRGRPGAGECLRRRVGRPGAGWRPTTVRPGISRAVSAPESATAACATERSASSKRNAPRPGCPRESTPGSGTCPWGLESALSGTQMRGEWLAARHPASRSRGRRAIRWTFSCCRAPPRGAASGALSA